MSGGRHSGRPVVEGAEQSFHQSVSAGIDTLQTLHPLKGVGEVTAATARDGYLGKESCSCLVDSDMCRGVVLCYKYGGKAACWSAADDGILVWRGTIHYIIYMK